jgi:hypothetical protein
LRLSALVWLFAAAAFAQKIEIGPVVAYQRMTKEFLGTINTSGGRDDDTRFAHGIGYGVRFTWNTRGYWGHEITLLQNRIPLRTRVVTSAGPVRREEKVKIRQGAYNLLAYFMPRDERWRPFITGGIHLHDYPAPNFAEWTTSGSRNYGGNFGGGIKFVLFKHAIFRIDVRQYIGGKPYDLTFQQTNTGGFPRGASGGLIRQLEGTAGVSIGF